MFLLEWTFFSQANIHTWDVYSWFEQRVELFLRVSGNISTKAKLIHHFLFWWTSLLCRMNNNMRGNHLLVSSAAATHPKKKETRNGPGKFWKRENEKALKYQKVTIKWLVRRTLEFGFTRDRRTDFWKKRSEEADGLAWRIYTLSEFSRDDCWVRDYNPLKPVDQPPHSLWLHGMTLQFFPYHSSRIFPSLPALVKVRQIKQYTMSGWSQHKMFKHYFPDRYAKPLRPG